MTDAHRIQRAVNNLQFCQVAEYAKAYDKLFWIEHNILDPMDLPRHLAEYAEDLIEMKYQS